MTFQHPSYNQDHIKNTKSIIFERGVSFSTAIEAPILLKKV